MSYEHKLYLKKRKRKKRIIFICQISIIILFITIWQLLASFELINTFITSSPKDILDTLINLHNTNNLYEHIWVTTYETLISFGLGTLLGIIIATILWWYDYVAKIIDPYLTILNSLPKIALGPIILIWCGANIKSIILMALFISLIVTIINIYQGFLNVDNNKIKLLKTFKASKKQIYFKLILPNSYNNIISTLKISISMSLIGIIMGEFLVSKSGIGYLIMYGSQIFNLNLVMTGIILLGILSAFMYYAILYIEKLIKK